jgi:hypothetical protein
VAERACDIAAKAMDQFIARGWTLDLPLPKEAEDKTGLA